MDSDEKDQPYGELQKMSQHPLADYYGAGLAELWNEDWVDEIN